MPRLLGYQERINTNVWDAFSPSELINPHENYQPRMAELRLFGNKNIGREHLTNLQVAGQLATDQTMVIMNWYARTNVMDALDVEDRSPLARAWHAFRHATLATLVIGGKPMAQRPLSDLMGPRHWFGGDGELAGLTATERTERVYKAWRHHVMSLARPRVAPPTWNELSDKDRDHWGDVAASIRPFHCPVICPLREMFSVKISSDRSALGALLELIPHGVAPQTLIWVHLDGIVSREVA